MNLSVLFFYLKFLAFSREKLFLRNLNLSIESQFLFDALQIYKE